MTGKHVVEECPWPELRDGRVERGGARREGNDQGGEEEGAADELEVNFLQSYFTVIIKATSVFLFFFTSITHSHLFGMMRN